MCGMDEVGSWKCLYCSMYLGWQERPKLRKAGDAIKVEVTRLLPGKARAKWGSAFALARGQQFRPHFNFIPTCTLFKQSSHQQW